MGYSPSHVPNGNRPSRSSSVSQPALRRHGNAPTRTAAPAGNTGASPLAIMPAAVACPGGGPARKLHNGQRVRARRVRVTVPHTRAAALVAAPRRLAASWAGRACGFRSAERRSCSHPARHGGGADIAILCCPDQGVSRLWPLTAACGVQVARVDGAKYALLPASLFPPGTRLLQAELVEAVSPRSLASWRAVQHGGGSPRDAAVVHFCGQPSKAAAAAASALSIRDGLEACGARGKALPALDNPLEPGQRCARLAPLRLAPVSS